MQFRNLFTKWIYGKTGLLSALLIIILLGAGSYYSSASPRIGYDEGRISVPLGGNTWRSSERRGGGRITNEGIANWSDKDCSFTTYVRLARNGLLDVWLQGNVPNGQSVLQISINGVAKEVKLSGAETKEFKAGQWKISDTGYVAIHIKAVSKTGHLFANLGNILLGGSVVNDRTTFVKNNEGNFFYWGRRGPSVHLNYSVPDTAQVEWFYNEITVPEGNDVLGSYFMADGFGEGYFGMQVNSPTTRHILFSVWSPYKTDNPNEIPDSQKIQLLAKGAGVHAGEFGNEGSGGQSYMNYMWKAGATYKFLLHGIPDGKNHTIYTAYFYEPENGQWHLIASFRRPQTNTYLKRLHSFLENFSPNEGDKERHVLFGNQWVRTNKGQWIELNKIRFTTDNTGRKGYRMDFAGGVKGSRFFLQNCGFFSQYTVPGKSFERPLTGRQPQIDFNTLPAR